MCRHEDSYPKEGIKSFVRMPMYSGRDEPTTCVELAQQYVNPDLTLHPRAQIPSMNIASPNRDLQKNL